ncbi:MAG: TetR/AcrR family transcriptional regulator [Erysipelotrichaceae bacterium]|nr:TetR/AcrR family transcriptional regulator [Erysipelotrichaceae bacterium]
MIVSKNEMMEKSIEMFKEHGYEQVSIPMICKHFGVTKGSFYHHFKSKGDLLLQWVIENYSKIESGFYHDDSLSDYENYRKKQMIWADFLNRLGRDFSLSTLKVILDYSKNPELYSSLELSKIHSLDASYVQRLQEQGLVTSVYSAEELVRCYTEMVLGVTIEWQLSKNDFNVIERIQFIFDFVYRK